MGWQIAGLFFCAPAKKSQPKKETFILIPHQGKYYFSTPVWKMFDPLADFEVYSSRLVLGKPFPHLLTTVAEKVKVRSGRSCGD